MSYVQVLSTPTADTPGTTLLLHYDHSSYLVGSLAEGTQRAVATLGAKISKVEHAFVTGRTEWSNIGGAFGMMLTLADSNAASMLASQEEVDGVVRNRAKREGWSGDYAMVRRAQMEAREQLKSPSLELFGSRNLNYAVATARRFIFRKGMPIKLSEIRPGEDERKDQDWAPYWSDDQIKVWPMSISSTNPTDSANSDLASFTNGSRKRSRGEMESRSFSEQRQVAQEMSQEELDLATHKSVVSAMFNSSWQPDGLHEVPLWEVKRPTRAFVRDPVTRVTQPYTGPFLEDGVPLRDPNLKVLILRPWPGAEIEALPPVKPTKEATSYIIRGHDVRGKFFPELAEKHKVERGSAYSELTRGQSVLNRDGETVTTDMVSGPVRSGHGFAVIDLPDPTYIDNLVSRPEWHEPKVMTGIKAVFWICGKDVATDQRVKDFISKFTHLDHTISSPDFCPNDVAHESVAAATVRLRKIDPDRYRVPFHDKNPPHPFDELASLSSAATGETAGNGSIRIAQKGQKWKLWPRMEYNDSQAIPLSSLSEAAADIPSKVIVKAVEGQLAIEADTSNKVAWANTIPDKDAEVFTLGTGSSLPSKYRNVSATLVRVPGWGAMLFDAGEGTLGQLKRVFPPQELEEVLQDLRAIFISHMHADHHLGITSVIKAWYRAVHNCEPASTAPESESFDKLFASKDRLAVISEPTMHQWLAEYAAVEDYGHSRIAPLELSPAFPERAIRSILRWSFSSSAPKARAAPKPSDRVTAMLDSITIPPSLLGFKDVQAAAVSHCQGALAFSVTLPSGFKVSYSGDCRPSRAFGVIGQDSTVCIHEATFDDDMRGDAMAKKHSTTSEAIGVAQAMRAKTCILTHFSQRYNKMPMIEDPDRDSKSHDSIAPPPPTRSDVPEPEEDGNASTSLDAADPTPMDTLSTDATKSDLTTFSPLFQADDPTPMDTHPTDPTTESDLVTYSPPALRATDPAAAVRLHLSTDLKLCVASDYMRVKVGEIGDVAKLMPAMLVLFEHEAAESARRKEENVEAYRALKNESVRRKRARHWDKGGDARSLQAENGA